MLEILFITFIVIIGLQLSCYLLLFGDFAITKPPKDSNHFNNPVSVIICCKNEAENLKRNLPHFLNQKYDKFELVLINDRSSDHTLEVMESFKETNSIIRIVDVADNEQFWGSKKYALTLGIKAASYNHLLFTDADCIPNSDQWIAKMSSGFSNDVQLILGYGAYQKIKKSLLNKLIRYETLLSAVNYFSFLGVGIPYMGVGRNMAYTKQLFFGANGFASHMHIRSGDDDLFVNENATAKNTAPCSDNLAFTTSIPKMKWKNWIRQKRRHISAAAFYKPLHKTLLGLFFISQLLFWILAIVLSVYFYRPEIVLSLIFIRLSMGYLIMGGAAKKLHENDLKPWYPVLEIFLIFAQLFIFIKNLTSKPSHW